MADYHCDTQLKGIMQLRPQNSKYGLDITRHILYKDQQTWNLIMIQNVLAEPNMQFP